MRRHLLLTRHAKSSWGEPSLADRDRPLAPRGVKALSKMHDHLRAATTPRPDLVLCSPARRTIDTLAGIQPALTDAVRIQSADDIYGAGVADLIGLLRTITTEIRCAMVVGHNPGLQDLALALVGVGDRNARDQLWEKFPTGAIATISFEVPWAALAPGVGQLEELFMPRRPRS